MLELRCKSERERCIQLMLKAEQPEELVFLRGATPDGRVVKLDLLHKVPTADLIEGYRNVYQVLLC